MISLRLAEAPTNPLTRKSRERTAGTFTTFPILNNILLHYANYVEFKWIEVMTESCNTTKIDGLAIDTSTKYPVVVVELAGGIMTHTEAKLKSDTLKIYDSCMKIIDKSEGRINNTHVVLFYNNFLSFEKMSKPANKLCSQIICPT